MMNLNKKNEEIKRLRQLVAKQKDTITKAMKAIETLVDDCFKLKAENKQLKADNKQLKADNKHLQQKVRYLELNDMYKGGFTYACTDVKFPNTDERGLGEDDTPTDLSPLD